MLTYQEEFEIRYQKRKAFEATLPAYSENSDITFSFEKAGLKFKFVTGEYHMDARCELKEFELEYNPWFFLPTNVIHKCFGYRKLKYTKEDVRFVINVSNMDVEGQCLEIFLRHPRDLKREVDNGPLLIISRYTGWVWFWPTDKKNILLRALFGITAEAQNFILRWLGFNRGVWGVFYKTALQRPENNV